MGWARDLYGAATLARDAEAVKHGSSLALNDEPRPTELSRPERRRIHLAIVGG
jgi:hypothetical protein